VPYNERTPGGGDATAAHQYPISRAFACVVAGAIVFLIILRYFYGSVRVEAGVK